MNRRPTQADVAKAAGVHRATVSLVFSNHPSIPTATKDRVMRCAKKLGYSPDPMLSALAVYRSQIRPKAFQGILAWLGNDVVGDPGWKEMRHTCDYYKGASARAQQHGFRLEPFDLKKSAPSPERLASIFRSRGIRGIMLPPQIRPQTEIRFPWDYFSATTFGYSLVNPKLHTLAPTQFRAMVETMRQLKRLGYQRIGFFFTAAHDEKTDHNYLAGYLVETFGVDQRLAIPPLFSSELSPQLFHDWYVKYRPDALVTGNTRNILDFLNSLGIRVPQELGVASPFVYERNSVLAGMYEDSVHIGEAAMDFLVGMIHRGERGVPEQPQRIHIEGKWRSGKTVRQAVSRVD